jgi:ABC-type transport system involved in cytochrome bd biosynthesis fused ATPase/permease subunit
VVFSGSFRSNLDPFGDAGSDERIWEALGRVRLNQLCCTGGPAGCLLPARCCSSCTAF